MKKIRISAVSYLNTLPFIYGMEQDAHFMSQIELSQEIPSVCAQKLRDNEVDIGLIPVAALPEIQNAQIISDYCIGAVGAVHSVLLVSEVQLNEIETIYLDYQSRTSVRLCRLLVENYWNLKVEFKAAEAGYEKQIAGTTAGVIIGDRTFDLEERFTYRYDLSEAWMEWQKLPFVFAVWVSNKALPQNFVNQFNQALKAGLSQKNRAINHYNLPFPNKDLQEKYLDHYIQYDLDEEKRKALELYLSLIQ